MAKRAASACRYPGCPELVWGGGYCEEHARQRQHRQDAERGSAAQRGYGARWRKLRTMYLRAHPLCVDLWGGHPDEVVVATEVDHIVPLARGGSSRWDNLQSLCKSCHSRKTAVEDSGFIKVSHE